MFLKPIIIGITIHDSSAPNNSVIFSSSKTHISSKMSSKITDFPFYANENMTTFCDSFTNFYVT